MIRYDPADRGFGEFEFYGSLHDPLSIKSLFGSEELLLKMLETSNFVSHDFLPNTDLLAVDQALE